MLVVIEAASEAAVSKILQRIQELGGRERLSHSSWVQAFVPILHLEKLAELPEVQFIRTPVRPILDQGSVVPAPRDRYRNVLVQHLLGQAVAPKRFARGRCGNGSRKRASSRGLNCGRARRKDASYGTILPGSVHHESQGSKRPTRPDLPTDGLPRLDRPAVADQKAEGRGQKVEDRWGRRFQAEGQAGLSDRSRRPHSCPRQTSKAVEAQGGMGASASAGNCGTASGCGSPPTPPPHLAQKRPDQAGQASPGLLPRPLGLGNEKTLRSGSSRREGHPRRSHLRPALSPSPHPGQTAPLPVDLLGGAHPPEISRLQPPQQPDQCPVLCRAGAVLATWLRAQAAAAVADRLGERVGRGEFAAD